MDAWFRYWVGLRVHEVYRYYVPGSPSVRALRTYMRDEISIRGEVRFIQLDVFGPTEEINDSGIVWSDK